MICILCSTSTDDINSTLQYYRVWRLVIEHMQVPMFETHHSIYLHKYLNMFDH